MEFIIRDAMPSDSEFIAKNVLAAMGYEVFNDAAAEIDLASSRLSVQEAISVFSKVCIRPDTLYSFARTRIACVNGTAVGSLTAYSGDDYLTLRERTWGLLDDSSDMLSMQPECSPGEFYLDSLAVLPEYRRMTFEYAGTADRIGHLLMLDGIEAGRRQGFPRISLIVDRAKPRLNAYYSALDFQPDGEIIFFGHSYRRMVKDLITK
jgi:ribosomal protein S18 acetylase RimI-like enzyme